MLTLIDDGIMHFLIPLPLHADEERVIAVFHTCTISYGVDLLDFSLCQHVLRVYDGIITHSNLNYPVAHKLSL